MKTKELIEVNQEGIDKQQAKLKVLIPFLQSIYDMFAGLEVFLHIEDFNTVVGCSVQDGYNQTLTDLVFNRMLENKKYQKLAGLPKNEIMRTMKIPNMTSEIKWIVSNMNIEREGSGYIHPIYLELVDGRVVKIKDADSIIKEKFTKRTLMPDYEAINKRPTSISKVIKNLFK